MKYKTIIKIILSLVLVGIAFPLSLILYFFYAPIFLCNTKDPSGYNCLLNNIISIVGSIVIVFTIILNLFRKKLFK